MTSHAIHWKKGVRPRTRRTRSLHAAVAALALAAGLAPARVGAETPPPLVEKTWDERYDEAYAALTEGKLPEAAALFHALARTARTERERALAHELARLATESAERSDPWPALAPTHPSVPAAPASPARPIRGTDELTLLYASGVMYGSLSGVWFLLQTQPDSPITATLPFAALTAAPVIAVATIDGIRPLGRGVPHAISAGLYLGLGESIFLVGMQQARAARLQARHPSSDVRLAPETVTGLLWTGATLGATLGGALGAGLETTPGRVSFTASVTLWSGVLSGLAAGALLPDDERRRERAFLIGGAGYDAGLVGGLVFAGRVSPSVARVRIADLVAIAGGLATTGAYLSLARDVDVRAAEGLAAGGLAAGLATGWFLTRDMAPDRPRRTSATPPPLAFHPAMVPVPAGAGVGVSGTF